MGILESFNAIRQNKQEIILDLGNLIGCVDDVRNALMHPIERDDKVREDDDFTNLFRDDFVTLFPKVQSLIIRVWKWSLSVPALLSLIKESDLKKIIVITDADWIERLWKKEELILTKQ